MAPWADVLYACDGTWWDYHITKARETSQGEFWTYDQIAAEKYGLNWIEGRALPGLGTQIMHTGGNSGYQAVNLAYLFGARKIVLLGFDMQNTNRQTHWHGDHPGGLNKPSPLKQWVVNFRQLAADLKTRGVEVINASRETALDCFERKSLEEALCH